MQPVMLAQDIAMLAATKGAHQPTLVAIDGPDTSGKTTLADGITRDCEELGRHAVRIEADQFLHKPERRYQQGRDSPIGFFEDSYDLEALTQRVLLPLAEGDRWVVRRHYDRERDLQFDDLAEQIPLDSIVIIDGLFLLRRELRRFWSLTVLLEVIEGERLTRARKRDAARLGGVKSVTQRYRGRYFPGYALYLDRECPQDIADIIIDNNHVDDPQVVRWPDLSH